MFRLNAVLIASIEGVTFDFLQMDIHCICFQGVKRFECEQCKQRFNLYVYREKRDLSASSVNRDLLCMFTGGKEI